MDPRLRVDRSEIVYDLGGGTFGVSLPRSAPRSPCPARRKGTILGGKDWDDRILRYVADRFRDETGLDLADVER